MQIPYITANPADGVQHGVFDSEQAEAFEGTGPQDPDGYEMTEFLYRVPGSAHDSDLWVLLHNRTGTDAQIVYESIGAEQAKKWLQSNSYPEAAKRYFERPRGGRPSIGPKVKTSVTQRTYDRIQQDMERWGLSEAEVVRARVELGYTDSAAGRLRRLHELDMTAARRGA
ncbi:hypothetical protein OG800_50590 (plasmid) [Streptomyces sp. NBC_00445]|uniref:hypothetical protein n=1 Tax=Streptomyces sp. NBC_00445 TaxID=2975745 RepID=UPI002E1BDB7A